MKTFVKAVEVWAPQKGGNTLSWVSGHYGDLQEFRGISEKKTFEFNRGLPGKAWACGHPLVLTEFKDSYFERADAAQKAGITAGIALPVFNGQFLVAVVVFLCGSDEDTMGAIEVWHCDTRDSYDLSLMDGYFGLMEHFEHISRHISFRKGIGLPGETWQVMAPMIFNDLGASYKFIRHESAAQAGMTAGLGIPVIKNESDIYIMTFLSAKGTPIARQMEIWAPDRSDEALQFVHGYSEVGADLAGKYRHVSIAKGEGALGISYLTGFPSVLNHKSNPELFSHVSGLEMELENILVLPVLEQGRCKNIVAFYL